jgi:hypothetical protein
MPTIDKEKYLAELTRRKKESRVYQKHQHTGLLLADILEDRPHKALYIRLAKNNEENLLMRLAKQVAENKNVQNRGAYFMKVLQAENQGKEKKVAPRKPKKVKKKTAKKEQKRLF